MHRTRTRTIRFGLSNQAGHLRRRQISGGSVVQWNGLPTAARRPSDSIMLAQLQAENEELRGRAVELALAIQDLRDNRTQRT